MKGKIFIAWSGNNTLAQEVKSRLENEDYTAVVGGEDGSANSLFVGDAVLSEINLCNQAICIVQKKADGTISNNLMFEFGYSLAKFSSNKIHVFYIDISDNDTTIPSDIRGSWADHYMSTEHEDIASDIVKKFLSNQKHIIPENKMDIINNYYTLKDVIREYEKAPQYSEYELAQYILFFSQAAYMFNNEKEALGVLQTLSDTLLNPSQELEFSIILGKTYLEMLLAIQKNNDTLFLKKADFRECYDHLRELLDEDIVKEWTENQNARDDYARWFLVILYDILNYATILYCYNPDAAARRERMLKQSIEVATKCLAICDELLKNPSNTYFIELYKAYMFRNLATAKSELSEKDPEIAADLKNSYKMRKRLWDHYKHSNRINATLHDTFELEYYLALSEQLKYIESEFDLDDFKDECQDYIDRVNALNLEKTHFIHRIEINISTAD